MSLIDRLIQLERLDSLIRRKGTGNREALAYRMGVSSRTVANLIDELRQFGAEIAYCRYRRSYYYEKSINFQFNIVQEEESLQHKGGKNIFSINFQSWQLFCQSSL